MDELEALRAEVERLRAGLYPLSQHTPKSAWALAEDCGATEDSLLVQWIRERDKATAAEAALAKERAIRARVEALADEAQQVLDDHGKRHIHIETWLPHLRAALSGESDPATGAGHECRDPECEQHHEPTGSGHG
jgi:hypothetical protein